MLTTKRGARGIVTAPHHLASGSGIDILRQGGTAIEAAVAMAASLAVVYPQMNSIGGDSFWLIAEPGREPLAIDGCGAAAAAADLALYRKAGHDIIPWRGPLAANTIAGTISAWDAALALNRTWGGSLPLSRLLRDAIDFARDGVPVADGMAQTLALKYRELAGFRDFAAIFLAADRTPLSAGALLRQPQLAATLENLVAEGLDSFYRGATARSIAGDLHRFGSPVALADLERHQAQSRVPLHADLRVGRLYNFPPPTQGLASLLILALFDRLHISEPESLAHVSGILEASKRAFAVRDQEIGDPAYMTLDPQALLDDTERLDRWAAEIARGMPAATHLLKPHPGDTVWFGAIDRAGRAVSVIQSTYFEFGSGLVLPETGITWQNRGASFRLAAEGWNALRPGRKPFHTLNPAMARLRDGRLMIYGTMGGEGQPQTQAAIFSRYALFGEELQQSITAPRWLLGRTWGEESTSLKLENRFPDAIAVGLRERGYPVEIVPAFSDLMGHAGALVRHADGMLEGASDPRSDGAAAAW